MERKSRSKRCHNVSDTRNEPRITSNRVKIHPRTYEEEVVRSPVDELSYSSPVTISANSTSDSSFRGDTTPIKPVFTESFIEKYGSPNGSPWNKPAPKDEFALLADQVIDRYCSRTSYAVKNKNPDCASGPLKLLDDVELLERGIITKSGNRRLNCADGEDIRSHLLSTSSPILCRNGQRNNGAQKAHFGNISTTTVDETDCFSATEQVRRRLRSQSPAPHGRDRQGNRALGSIVCQMGNDQDRAIMEYAIGEDSRTYSLTQVVKPKDKKYRNNVNVTLEFGPDRSYLTIAPEAFANPPDDYQ
ncbi:hypothetical protein DdX_19130 [Ditylenchus destructor]|uniref:Uncharacterized protein n=1 Tax=Ditylenchus destructor TaxID=166010 RepID=A0AAD4MIB3_9BILA|nr:hypothetical protein DdX_19130 [Ditylenchus destructor]